jgi:putative tryptophan/tyrosine transport system substrate-binding protein
MSITKVRPPVRVLIALTGALALAACGSSGSSTAASSGGGKQYRFGVMALVPFTQLEDMLTGFKQSAKACGMVEGKNATYFIDFANGQQSALQIIAKQDVQHGVNLFVALDTPSMVTMAAVTKTVPVVAVAPTYPVASGVVKSLSAPGTNVTGGSDYIDPSVTISEMLKVLPNVKTIGMVYNPAEENSAQFQQAIKPALAAKGINLDQVSITGTGDVQQAVKGLAGRVDAILLGPDNTAISAAPEIAKIADQNKIPLVSYVSGVAVNGALMDLGANYLYLGQQAGDQACKILLHGGNPANMPFTRITNPVLTVNTQVAKQLGVTIPSAVLASATKVTTTGSS